MVLFVYFAIYRLQWGVRIISASRIKATLDLNPFAADSLLLRRGGRLPRWRVALRFLSIQKIPSWDVMSKTGTDDLIGYRKAFPTADFDKCYSDR
jgi:hypothetical protein